MNDLSKYELVRPLMRTGDLLQWRANSFIGAAIRWKTRNDRRQYEKDHDIDVNHSSIVIVSREEESNDLRVFTNESLSNGAVPNFLSQRVRDFDGTAWWYGLNEEWGREQRAEVGRRAFNHIGVDYDYWAIAKQAIGIAPTLDTRKLYCNEYYMVCLGLKSDTANNPNWLPNLNIFRPPVQII